MSKDRPRIAVIDDEEPVRKAIGRLLESVGMAVETFDDGGAFLAALGTRRPDCAVLDLHMAEVSGFDVMQRLAETGDTLPVVVITGRDSSEAGECVRRGGAAAYLCKPVNQRLLVDAITAALAHSTHDFTSEKFLSQKQKNRPQNKTENRQDS